MSKGKSDVEQIELSMEAAKEKVELMEALKRLEANKDFQKVIGDTYLNEYPVRLVRLRASYTMQRQPDQLAYIDNQINAIGFLSNYINFVFQEGHEAEQALLVDQEELNRIADEGEEV